MFKKNLYTYSFIKTLYDQKKDYLVAFAPLIYDGIPTDSCVPIEQVQVTVEQKRGLKFPLHIIKTVLTRGKREEFVRTQGQNLFCLTDKGVAIVNEIEDAADVERRINSLAGDLEEYFAAKKIIKNRIEVSEMLQKFIDTNLYYLVDLFGNGRNEEEIKLSRKDELLLLGYIKDAMEFKPNHFATLRELIYGSIIASLVYVRNTAELSEFGERSFKNARVYLDTNIVFSALGYHTEAITKSTNDLLNLIKQAGLELWVFEFTVDEMCSVFKSYGVESHKYPKIIGVDSIFSTFKQQGLGISDMAEMIGNIEYLLASVGIRIDPTPEVNLKNYESDNEQIRGRVGTNKSDKSLSNINHDLAAIDYVRAFRGSSVYKIEDPKAIFLTADNSLHKACIHSFDHIQKGTLPETILDRLFANILWLKNPDLDLPLNLMIAVHSRDLLVNRQIWERFFNVLTKLKNAGSVSEDQVATLFYNDYIEKELVGLSKTETEIITDEFVTEQIEKAGKIIQSTYVDLTNEKEELKESLLISQEELLQARQFVKQVGLARDQIKEMAKRWAGYLLHPVVFILNLVLTFIEGLVLTYFAHSISWSEIFLTLFLGGAASLIVVNWLFCEWVKKIIYPGVYFVICNELMKAFVKDTEDND